MHAPRRSRLLTTSALGVLAYAVVSAAPAHAQLTNTGSTSSGAAPTINTAGATTTVTTGGARTVMDWSQFDIASGDTVNFVFNANSDIVLNRVAGAASTIDGNLNGCVAACPTYGGNIWISNQNGVIFGGNARVNTGGLLATTATVDRATDASSGGFLDPTADIFDFSGAADGSSVSLQSGAQLTANRGTLALIAPVVTTAAGSSVTGTGGGDAFYGSASKFKVTFARTGTDDMDLLSFEVAAQGDGAGGTPGIALGGDTNANQVFAAVVSKSGVAASIVSSGNITATTASGEDGDVILSAGGGITGGAPTAPLGTEGTIVQSGGSITANSISASAAAGIDLSGANDITSATTIANLTTGAGDVAFRTLGDITLGTYTVPGALTLISDTGGITQAILTVVTATRLTASAASQISLPFSNHIGSLGRLTLTGTGAGANINIGSAGNVTLEDDIIAPGVGQWVLLNTMGLGSLVQNGGIIDTYSLSVYGTDVNLGGSNQIANLESIEAVGNGSIVFNNAHGYRLTGVIEAIGSSIALSLESGAITSPVGTAIRGDTLSISAQSGISLLGSNSVNRLTGLSTASGGITFIGDTSLDGAVNAAGQTVTLSGNISQTANGLVTADQLNMNSGALNLGTVANAIGTIGSLSGSSANLRVSGDLTIDGPVNLTGIFKITSPGAVSQTNAITAGSLAIAAGTGIALDGANDVANVTALGTTSGDISFRDINGFALAADGASAIATPGALSLTADSGSITQGGYGISADTLNASATTNLLLTSANSVANLGALSAGSLTFHNTGGIGLTGAISISGTLSLAVDAGSVTQGATSLVSAATLTGSASGDFVLDQANTIGTLGSLSATNLTLRTIGALDLTGTVNVSGATSLTAGGTLTQSAGSITGESLSASAVGGISLLRTANDIETLAGLIDTTSGAIAFFDADGYDIAGDVTNAGRTVNLTVGTGSVTQSGGTITAGTLTAAGTDIVNTDYVLDRANAVANLGTVRAYTFTLHNAGNLVLMAADLLTGDLTLRSDNGSITQTAAFSALSLTASAATGIALDMDNQIDTLHGVGNSTSGGIALKSTSGINSDGLISAPGQTVTLTMPAFVSAGSGRIVAGKLTATGSVLAFQALNNGIDEFGDISGDFISIGNSVDATLSGTISSSGTVYLAVHDFIATGSGKIVAPGLEVLGHQVSLTGDNDLDSISRFQTGAFTFNDIDDISLDNPLQNYGSATNLTITSGGTISQNGVGVTAGLLNLAAATGINFNASNVLGTLGALSTSAGDIFYRTASAMEISSAITAPGTVSLSTDDGAITQTATGLITANRLAGGTANGDMLLGEDNGIAGLGNITVIGGDLLVGTGVALTIDGDVTTGTGNAVTLRSTVASGPAIRNDPGGVIHTGTLNITALGDVVLSGMDVAHLGAIDPTLFDFSQAADIDLTSDITADTVNLTSTAGAVTQSSGIITAGTAAISAQTGVNLVGANQIGQISFNVAGGGIAFANDGQLTLGALSSSGDVDITVTNGGLFNLDPIAAAGNLRITADGDVQLLSNTVAGGDVVAMSSTGAVELQRVQAGDDIIVSAATLARVSGATIAAGGTDGEGDGFNLSITGATAQLGAPSADTIAPTDAYDNAGAGAQSATLTATAGDAVLFVDNMNSAVSISATGNVTASADFTDLLLGNVSGANVSLRSGTGSVTADSVTVNGDYTLTSYSGFSDGALDPGCGCSVVRDLSITQTTGNLTLPASLLALRNLNITLGNGDLVGNVTLSAGNGTPDGNITVNAANISLDALGAGNISLLTGTGDVDISNYVVVANDYTLTGAAFSDAALSPVLAPGTAAGTWRITSSGALDANGLNLTYIGDIAFNAVTSIFNGSITSANGTITLSANDIDLQDLQAAGNIGVTASGGTIALFSAGSTGGDIGLAANAIDVYGYLSAARDVSAAGADGHATVGHALAGRDISVSATNGDATLRQAVLNGATGNLAVFATDGDAILGADDYSSIDTDNVFGRAVGSTGTANVFTIGSGDALVNLDNSAALTTIEGDGADVTVANGRLTIGTLTARVNDALGTTLDGSMTIGAASAGDTLDLLALNGDLTIGSSATADTMYLAADGTLDLTGAGQIEAGSLLDLSASTILADALVSGGDLQAIADQNLSINTIDIQGFADLYALSGSATLRGGSALDGLTLAADGNVTLGADTKADIAALNSFVIGSCGCGAGGGFLVSGSGSTTVNIDTLTGGFDAIAAAVDGDVTVNLLSGDLTIGSLAAYNIYVDARNGALDILDPQSAGGAYTLIAQDFLSNALDPDPVFGTLASYSITDTLGGLAMANTVETTGDITIDVQNGGTLTGAAALLAGGDVRVNAAAIALDSVSGRDVTLDADAGTVDVATSISAERAYTLTGADFSAAALTPLGTKTGTWTITDTDGAFAYGAGGLSYGGSILVTAAGDISGGNITSTTGGIELGTAGAITIGVLDALAGGITVTGETGNIDIASARALGLIRVINGGNIHLGSALLAGAPTTLLALTSDGDITLGATTAGGITADNYYSALGGTRTASLSAGGMLRINLDSSERFNTLSGGTGIQAHFNLAGLSVASATSSAGAVSITVLDGTAGIDNLEAALASQISAGNNVSLGNANVQGNLTLAATTGDILLTGVATLTNGGTLSLNAGRGIIQTGGIDAASLDVTAGANVLLTGAANHIAALRDVTVTNADFTLQNLDPLSLTGTISVADGLAVLRTTGTIDQAAGATITAQGLGGLSGGNARFGGANRIGTLNGFAAIGGDFLLNNVQALTIDGGIIGDTVTIRSHGGLTIAPLGQVIAQGSGDAIVLVSDGTFANQRGADALFAGTGRWLVYTQAFGNPAGATAADDFGGLGGRSYYGSSYDFTNGGFSAVPGAGNRFVHAYRPVLTVTPDSFAITYNGQIPTLTGTITGLINGDAAANAWSGAPAYSGATSKNVGTYNLTAAIGSLASDMNYDFAFGTGTLRIDPKAITGTLTANSRTYDRTTDATGTVTLSGVVAGDSVSAAGTYSFDDRNAGTGKTVTANGITLSGGDAGNYTVNATAIAVADILAKALIATFTANSRTYDGTAGATGTLGLTGVIAGDSVGVTGSYAFADKKAGTGKTVTASGISLSGIDAGNYTVNASATALADILAKAITATLTANNKIYDGATAATGTLGLTGVIGADRVAASGSYAFADKNAGAGKTVTASGITLSGSDAGNYTVNASATAFADILAKAITATLTANSKTYDRTTAATGTLGLTGVVAGDSVGATGAYSFADRNAGTGKTVTANGITLSGADAGNYTVNASATALADILAKAITATLTVSNKTYDGTADATGTLGLSGVVVGDDVGVSGSYAFGDKDAGTGKTVAASGITLSGADARNYTVNVSATALANILAKAVTATLTANSKTYDATTTATGALMLNGVVAGDNVGVTGNYAFADKNAGAGKTVTASGIALSGTDAGNYTVNASATALADILAKAITATLSANNKTYDGTAGATGTLGLTGAISGDAVGVTSAGLSFADKTAGAGKTVTASGIVLNGADAGNYIVNTSATALADILAKAITATFTANSRTYDGTAGATGTLGLTGVIAGDSVGVTGNYAFADKNAGAGKTVTASGITLSGTDAGNYTVNASAVALADILAKAITATFSANNKTYDGTSAATGTLGLTGVIAGDAVGVTGSYSFADKNAGSGKIVTASGITLSGADAANYTVNASAATLADILAKAITATLTANSRTYDGTAGATGTLALSGVISGDSVGVTSTGLSFADKTAGTGKTVAASGIALSGADAGNYTVNASTTALADILAKAITATFSANNKTYDGTTGATGTLGLSGVIAGDNVGVTGNYAFADKNAAMGKIVSASGITLSGADAGNYTVNASATALADIARKALTGGFAANGKTYDGTTATTGSITLNGVIVGDSVVATGNYAFADPNAGAGRTVNVTGVTLNGADAGNYSFVQTGSVVADILRRTIAVTPDDQAKLVGQADPALTWRITAGTLVGSDAIAGSLARDPGEQAGNYAIRQGSLALSQNYQLIVEPATLTITLVRSLADGSDALKSLNNGKGYVLWKDPSANLVPAP